MQGRCGTRVNDGWWVFFFNDTATTEIYTLSLHDALPISDLLARQWQRYGRIISDALKLDSDYTEDQCRVCEIGRAHV